ncbi:MAG: M67 family metallopeptidase [Sphingomonas sp.]|nr:M67 family metallopeptidase [Sphingomonas sp.]
MVLHISTALTDAIRAQARAAGAQECCGLLLGDAATDTALHLLPCANVAADPLHRFEIDPAMLLAAHKAARAGGPAIIGHYHSHPTGEPAPSSVDAAMAQGTGELWLIVGRDGTLAAWRASPTGRLHGRFDPVEMTASPHPDLAPIATQGH